MGFIFIEKNNPWCILCFRQYYTQLESIRKRKKVSRLCLPCQKRTQESVSVFAFAYK